MYGARPQGASLGAAVASAGQFNSPCFPSLDLVAEEVASTSLPGAARQMSMTVQRYDVMGAHEDSA